MTASKKRTLYSSLLPSLALVFLTTLAGCPDREVAQVTPKPNKEQQKVIPVEINRDIDILFVIDNSGSMLGEQASLLANFPKFINVLKEIEGGLPNVHIGVISTDVGAGGQSLNKCNGEGDSGKLQTKPRPPKGSTCQGINGNEKFIRDVVKIDQTTKKEVHEINYPEGKLAETFSCIANLGDKGCGLEQPLEAMVRALNPENQTNKGFLRDNAFLAVIFITDEDDCSVKDGKMFDGNNSKLGALTSFRCFEYGIKCEPDDNPRAHGPRENCSPRVDSEYMANVDKYADELKKLKKDPKQIIIAGIIGNPTPVSVGEETQGQNKGEPKLQPSCSIGPDRYDSADPAIRLKAFLEKFPNRNTSTTICNEDLTDALGIVAELLTKVIGNPCMEGDIALTNSGQPQECNVQETRFKGTKEETAFKIPECNANKDNIPCYHFVVDTEKCNDTQTKLSLQVERGSADVPSETQVEVSCFSN